jgi:hypothetical protein
MQYLWRQNSWWHRQLHPWSLRLPSTEICYTTPDGPCCPLLLVSKWSWINSITVSLNQYPISMHASRLGFNRKYIVCVWKDLTLIEYKFEAGTSSVICAPVCHSFAHNNTKIFRFLLLVLLLGIFRRAQRPAATRGHPCAILLPWGRPAPKKKKNNFFYDTISIREPSKVS